MSDLIHLALPLELPSRANKRGKLKDQISLPGRQRRAVAAALGWVCPKCEAPAEPMPPALKHLPRASCSCSRLRVVVERQPLRCGPNHPVDALLIRVPAPGGRFLDDDNLAAALKGHRDGVADALCYWAGLGHAPLKGKGQDHLPWMSWHCRQRKRRLGDPEGSELLEVYLAPAESCRCLCAELRQAAMRWARSMRTERLPTSRDADLLRAIEEQPGQPCGCGRSMLPVRWERGEL